MTTAATIRALWEDGVTPDEKIARLAGVSRQRVHQVLGPAAERGLNVVAAFREIRDELERPVVLTIHSPLYEPGVGTHGTGGAYRSRGGRGCRCPLCTNANRLAHRAYLARRRTA